ncbi:uncharacterized protein LOC111709806 [Eurytemora carolleeae]|uniref:uncharacterized protein LOC111709806 n=1 Tax=Eurytemora carolleeae TaxID=1294199 RepID=UPI000C7744E4|nr:uncharacterized protein LOC111709806 [Eurytemora carolleeae]|eukprot:XP_023339486.1 uncharacterized protein LOC111709806 [Eurytemora affinis]
MKFLCILILSVLITQSVGRRQQQGTCGLTCFRWRKCKAVLNTLTSTDGDARPGQRGTTGQLIFDKCEDPPAKCSCEEEPKPKEPTKPRMPKSMLDYVDESAVDWFTNLVHIDQ